jgi:hypothetical protein
MLAIRKLIKIFMLLFLFVHQTKAEERTFDFAWNIGSFGWGMNIPSEENHGGFKIDMLNVYIEHSISNIGIKFSPFNCWTNYSFSEQQIHFINIGLFYNLANLGSRANDEDIDEYKKSQNYVLLSPFISINYLEYNTNKIFNKSDFQITIGLQFLTLFDSQIFFENSLPFGFQFFNIELGYSFKNNGNGNFYFMIGTDVLGVLLIYGLFNKA